MSATQSHQWMLAPPPTRSARRSRTIAMLLAVSLAVLLGCALTVSATAAPGGPVAAQQPAPTPTAPVGPSSSTPNVPIPIQPGPSTSYTCFPGPIGFECPTQTTLPTPRPPCSGEGCIPQPPASTAPNGPGGPGQPTPPGEQKDECGISNIGACITEAITAFFEGIVEAALNPLLDLLGRTLLTTPTPDSMPRIGELWNNSWEILLVSYGLLILIGDVLIMSYQSLQTRYSVKEIAPRLVVGFLAGALSLWVATKAIQIANALSHAVMGSGLDPAKAGKALRDLVLGSLKGGGIWLIFIGLVVAVMLVVLLVTYVVRVAITTILIAGAPLALMGHALPQTEGIAQWWWKAFGGCLAIQVGQSLTLIAAMQVFFTPGGFTLFGPTMSGLVNLLVVLALLFILFKIPSWFLGPLRSGGRSLLGNIVRGLIAYKTFGLLSGKVGGRGSSDRHGGARQQRAGGDDPYARAKATSDGQLLLPLTGVRRTRRTRTQPAPMAKSSASPGGKQLGLPLGDDWPENRPVLGRDGQYRLPLNVERVKPTPPPPTPSGATTGRRRAPQLELPFDPYKGNRPTRSGQYPLPLEGVQAVKPPRPPVVPPAPRVTRVVQPELPFDPYKGNRPSRSGQYPLPFDGVRPVPTPTPVPVPLATPAPRTAAAAQMELPFDPYKGNRPTRSGQYPLPLEGVHRVPSAPTKPAPAEPSPARSPRAGRQMRLPLDLPKPARHTRSPRPKPGGRKP